jgi:O-antigen/teichoic acid export membrane protein
MPRARVVIVGVFMNWATFVVTAGVAFFLSPFLVHHLGDAVYGIWILVSASVGYLGLLDLGLRGAVLRYLAKHHADSDHESASRIFSAGLLLRFGIAAMVIEAIFKIPLDQGPSARWAVLISGASLAVSLTTGIFGAALAALHRFDLLSGTSIGQTVLMAVGTVWLLTQGFGIVALAALLLGIAVLAGIAQILCTFYVYPQLRVLWVWPSRETLHLLWSYSLHLFILTITFQIIYYSDNAVVGIFLSTSAVTLYTVGGRLLEYLRQPIAGIAQSVMPLASTFEAEKRVDRLQQLLIHGTQFSLLVSFPLAAALFARGPTFISLWMGAKYGEPSGMVMRILLLAHFVQTGNHVSGNVIFGLGKHRALARWQIFEAIANLTLSVVLVQRLGIYGVAWGTVIPSLVTNLVLWPRYVTGLLQLRVWHYLIQAWLRPALATVPFALACFWTDRVWHASNLAQLAVQIAALLPVFAVSVAGCFWPELAQQIREPDSIFHQKTGYRFRRSRDSATPSR